MVSRVVGYLRAALASTHPTGLQGAFVPGTSAGGLRLHLGCGERYLPGYVNIDFPADVPSVQVGRRPDLTTDIRTLEYPPSSVEEIRLHHVFEHFDRPTGLRLLVDWYDWLVAGGCLVIETPDFLRCAAEIQKRPKNAEGHLLLLRHIFGSHEAAWAVHQEGWYKAKFELVLTSLGYGDIAFEHTSWEGTYNITVTCRKCTPAVDRATRHSAALGLLRLSLINDSETELRLMDTWHRTLLDPAPR